MLLEGSIGNDHHLTTPYAPITLNYYLNTIHSFLSSTRLVSINFNLTDYLYNAVRQLPSKLMQYARYLPGRSTEGMVFNSVNQHLAMGR